MFHMKHLKNFLPVFHVKQSCGVSRETSLDERVDVLNAETPVQRKVNAVSDEL